MDDLRNFLLQTIPAQATIDDLFWDARPIDANGGGGAFSTVFKAQHLPTKRDVALKFLSNTMDSYRRNAFEREGRLLNTTLRGEPLFVQLVAPPSVLTVTVQVEGGIKLPLSFSYLPFEWLPDGNLEQFSTPTYGYLDLISRLTLFKEACRCVGRLHFLRGAHRDLKPGNLFLVRGSDPKVKLGDFGTARIISSTEAALLPFYPGPPGDMRYAGLETLACVIDEMDLSNVQRGDLYSLGAILFEFITGSALWTHQFLTKQKLFEFKNYVSSIPIKGRLAALHEFLKTTRSPIPDLRKINPHIPRCVAPKLQDLILRLSHHDYRERARTVDEVHSLLRLCILVLRNEAKDRRVICNEKSKRRPDQYV